MTQVDSKKTITLIEISDNQGNIKPEYLDSYNRKLTDTDIERMIELYRDNKRQQIVEEFNVRKIIGSNELIVQFIHTIVSSSDLELFEFVFDKLSYDDKAACLYKLNAVPVDMLDQIQTRVDKFGLDYSEEFDLMRQRCGLMV